MYRTQQQTTRQKTFVWIGAEMFVVLTLIASIMWPLFRASSEQYGPQLLKYSVAAVLPKSDAGIQVRTGSTYEPGTALAIIPGLQVFVDPSEIASFSAEDAINRGAGVLTDALFTGGTNTVTNIVGASALAPQLHGVLSGPLPALVAPAFETELFAAGMADGNRLTDWRAQQQANPNRGVQPLIGVFVQVDPALLSGVSARDIGVIVVRELTQTVLRDGRDAATELLGNTAHLAAFERAIPAAQQRAHDMFTVLLFGFATEIEDRLAQARDAGSGTQVSQAIDGLVSESELAQLSAEQREDLIAKRIADRVYEVGGVAAARSLTDANDRQALTEAASLLKWFEETTHERLATWLVVVSIVAVLAVVLMAMNTRSVVRFGLPGLLVFIALVPTYFAARYVAGLPETYVWQPAINALARETVTYGMYVGAGLFALQIIVLIAGQVRPRRRRRML